jgi:hypothetical protein
MKRNENDKQALDVKVAAKKAAQDAAAVQASWSSSGGVGGGVVVPRKTAVAPKNDSLDALLNSGLSGKKSTAKV